jgi:hypothetical protein
MKTKLADIAEIRMGYPFRAAVKPIEGGTLAVVQMKDVDESAGLIPEACLRIKDEPERYEKHLLQIDDVLLQSRGSKFPSVVFDKPLHAIATLGLIVIRPGSETLPAYLSWLLNQARVREALRAVARGTYIPFLSKADVEALNVSLPPLDTQKRIVHVDALRRRESALRTGLVTLSDQYTDALVWKAIASNSRKILS